MRPALLAAIWRAAFVVGPLSARTLARQPQQFAASTHCEHSVYCFSMYVFPMCPAFTMFRKRLSFGDIFCSLGSPYQLRSHDCSPNLAQVWRLPSQHRSSSRFRGELRQTRLRSSSDKSRKQRLFRLRERSPYCHTGQRDRNQLLLMISLPEIDFLPLRCSR